MDTTNTNETEELNKTGEYTDIMVDIETTGLSPDRSAVIQLSAVLFNVKTQEVSPKFFNRMLRIPNWRHWDQGTLTWWSKQKPGLLQSILSKGEDPAIVWKDFIEFSRQPENKFPVFWSKPSHFDFMFVQSSLNDHDLFMPFSHVQANDLRSFLRGLYFPEAVPDLNVDFSGTAHNALHDVLHQLKILFSHIEDVKNAHSRN